MELVKPNSHIDLHTFIFQSALAESRLSVCRSILLCSSIFEPTTLHSQLPQHTQHTCFHHPHDHNLLQQQQFSRVSQTPFFLEVTPSVSSSVTHTHTHIHQGLQQPRWHRLHPQSTWNRSMMTVTPSRSDAKPLPPPSCLSVLYSTGTRTALLQEVVVPLQVVMARTWLPN